MVPTSIELDVHLNLNPNASNASTNTRPIPALTLVPILLQILIATVIAEATPVLFR